MLRRPKSSDSTRKNPTQGVSSLMFHTPPPNPHGRPNWMCLQDIPDESSHETLAPQKEEKSEDSNIWDGNKKLFVQLLDDMDNIGGVDGLTDGSARRRKKARELFTDWLFRSKKSDKPETPQSPQLRQTRNNNMHRFSGDFTNYNVQIPVAESPKAIPGRLERQAPSRRSCGIIGDRKHLYAKWRHSSVHVSNEDEADSGYHSGNIAILGRVAGAPQSPGELTLSRQDLKKRIEKFNATNTHGLLMEMPLDRSSLFEGFIRVHMNLIRPINMRVCKAPPTFVVTLKRNKHKKKGGGGSGSCGGGNSGGDCGGSSGDCGGSGEECGGRGSSVDEDGGSGNNNINNNGDNSNINNNTNESPNSNGDKVSKSKNTDNNAGSNGVSSNGVSSNGRGSKSGGRDSLISFSLPKNTSKVIHINSSTKTSEVVTILLSKFNISDSPRKFSLYERIELPGNKPSMRKMMEDEQPLMMCLVWEDGGGLDHHRFVLQENDAGEIMWEAFSLPELESFLTVLNREETECIRQVTDKFRLQKIQLSRSDGGNIGGVKRVKKPSKMVGFLDENTRESSKMKEDSRISPRDGADDGTATFSSSRAATIKSNIRYHKQHRSLDGGTQTPFLPSPPFEPFILPSSSSSSFTPSSFKPSSSSSAVAGGGDSDTLRSGSRQCGIEDV